MASFKYCIPFIGWSVLILILSTGPGVDLPESWWDLIGPDKWGHAFVYAVETILLLWAITKTTVAGSLSTKWWIIAILCSSCYGISMEIIQEAFFPNRYFEVLDILANIIGSLIGAWIFKRFLFIKTQSL